MCFKQKNIIALHNLGTNSLQMEDLKKFWLNFFKDAGLKEDVNKYAAEFVTNRMTSSLVPDLTEEVLRKLHITKMGDILLILKHAKKYKLPSDSLAGG